MRKLDLTGYTVKRTQNDPMKPGEVIEYELPYMVKDSILNVMFTTELQLNGAELVKQNAVALKIEGAEGGVLLEEEEFKGIKRAFEVCKGFKRDDVQLVERINNTEQVKVEQT